MTVAVRLRQALRDAHPLLVQYLMGRVCWISVTRAQGFHQLFSIWRVVRVRVLGRAHIAVAHVLLVGIGELKVVGAVVFVRRRNNAANLLPVGARDVRLANPAPGNSKANNLAHEDL